MIKKSEKGEMTIGKKKLKLQEKKRRKRKRFKSRRNENAVKKKKHARKFEKGQKGNGRVMRKLKYGKKKGKKWKRQVK